MSNIFIRTNIAPYRVDTYNALHEKLGMKMCFYRRKGKAQNFDVDAIEARCSFTPVYLKGITLGRESRKLCFGIWRMLRKERPELVIVPEFQICAVQVLLYRFLSGRKFKVVSMTDDSYDMIAGGNDFTRLHAGLRGFFPKYLDDLIVVTPEVRDWYQKNYGKGIWLPILMDDSSAVVNYERILPLSRKIAEEYELSGKRVVLSVSRLVELKNLHRVIDAFARTEEDAVLVIVGDGPERESLEKHASEVGKEVLFTGRFDGDMLYAWYNLASVFVLASIQESFGAVTNEALLSGCRVVISGKAGSACLVDASNGETIDPEDIDCIAAAIDRQLRISHIPGLETARNSLMTVSFQDRINNLVQSL